MVLLQAAMMAGFFLVGLLIIFLIVGTPILTGVLMKTYWRLVNKRQNIIDKKPYYKDPLPFAITIILSIIILVGLFYLLIILFDSLSPNFHFD